MGVSIISGTERCAIKTIADIKHSVDPIKSAMIIPAQNEQRNVIHPMREVDRFCMIAKNFDNEVSAVDAGNGDGYTKQNRGNNFTETFPVPTHSTPRDASADNAIVLSPTST